MIDRVAEKLAIRPRRPVGDTNYGVAAMLGWLVNEKQIIPHVPVWDKSDHRDDTFMDANQDDINQQTHSFEAEHVGSPSVRRPSLPDRPA